MDEDGVVTADHEGGRAAVAIDVQFEAVQTAALVRAFGVIAVVLA